MIAAHARLQDELLVLVAQSLCTRPLATFARESLQDGESLKDAVERYEVDYAWHVLGSERLRDETIRLLESKLTHAASDAQKASVTEVLKAAAAGQGADALMSFDSDVPEQVATLIYTRQKADARAAADALS